MHAAVSTHFQAGFATTLAIHPPGVSIHSGPEADNGADAGAGDDADRTDGSAPASESRARVLAAITPDEPMDGAAALLRAAQRFAADLNADWTVISVDPPSFPGLPNTPSESRTDVFRLAESLGAETTTVEASSPPEALMEYASLHGARYILVGASRSRYGWRPLHRSTVNALLRLGGNVDIMVLTRAGGDRSEGRPGRLSILPRTWSKRVTLISAALGLTALCSGIALLMLDHFDLLDIGMVYMLGATLAALRLGLGPAVVTSLANIAAFDFLLVPPRYSFFVSEPHYFVTFGVMLAVSVVIAKLVSAVRQQTTAAAARESRTAALYSMSRELAITRDAQTMVAVAERHIAEIWRSSVVVRIRDKDGRLSHRRSATKRLPDPAICEWVIKNQQRAGLGTTHCGAEPSVYVPLLGSQDVRGVLIVSPADPVRVHVADQSRLLDALAGQLALALERVWLADVAESAHVAAERAMLRNTLLASISHDLRTPLSAIAGAGSMMAHGDFSLDEHRRTTLGRLIEDKARDMTELLSNVLELIRLEGSAPVVRREWHLLEDLIGLTLRHNEVRLVGRQVLMDVPADLPMLFVEGGLIVQMLSNLVENSIKYTPPETRIVIAARVAATNIVVSVEDNGPGFSAGDTERLFDKFERGRTEGNVAGVGLGLAICRAVARLHGGDIRAIRVPAGGARFVVNLPLHPAPLDGNSE
jgi:two-component system, OmpR family, sensor histidine kinase KdpD